MTKVRRLRLGIVAGILLLAAAACGTSEDETVCVRAHGALVCGDTKQGSVTVRAEGLRPGSSLKIEAADVDAQTYAVGPDGRPEATINFIGGEGSGPLVLKVAGTAADGSPVEGDIAIGG